MNIFRNSDLHINGIEEHENYGDWVDFFNKFTEIKIVEMENNDWVNTLPDGMIPTDLPDAIKMLRENVLPYSDSHIVSVRGRNNVEGFNFDIDTDSEYMDYYWV